MGRTIIAEEGLENNLSSFFVKDKWFIGVIIGQITDQRDYVLHLATTPKPEVSDDAAETANNEAKDGDSLLDTRESWVAHHARQVRRMLPGGLDILGLFAVAHPDVMKAAQPKLRQVLFALYKNVGADLQSTERIVLQICPITRKLTCRTFDVADLKSAARPADWKYQRYSDKVHRLECKLAVHCTIPVHNNQMSHSLEKQILNGIQPFCDNIKNSIATIDYQMVTGDETLVPAGTTGKKGKKQQEDTLGKTFNINFYEVMPVLDRSSISAPVITPCGAKLSIRGTMMCRAFVPSKATKKDAIQALKLDAVRSLTSRCELLCEDFLQTEEEQDRKVLYETPLRVFAPLGESNIQLCDYMFPDETNNDVVDRFKELLNTTIPEDTLETDCEKLPDNISLEDTEVEVQESDVPHYNFNKTEQTSFNVIVYVLGVMAVLLAVLVGFLYQRELAT